MLQLLLENERLHQQLETARRQISEKTERSLQLVGIVLNLLTIIIYLH